MEYSYGRVLDEIAAAGYAGTELGPYGFLPSNPPQLQHELQQRGLRLCSAFVAMPLGDGAPPASGLEPVQRTAELIASAGATMLILSDELTPERSAVAGRLQEANALGWNEDEWQRAVGAIRAVVECCRRYCLGVAFHHHVGTHVETPDEIERLLSLFPPEELGLCLDSGHCVYGGGEPVDLVYRHGGRVRWVHLKDVNRARLEEARQLRLDFHRAVRHGVFAALGQGIVDFGRLLRLLAQKGYGDWVVVEQDVLAGGEGAGTPLANAAAARNFLRGLGL
jgi:inosose dehydratase